MALANGYTKLMFRPVDGQQSNRLILEVNSQVVIMTEPDARIKFITE